ncbi:putative toxin-antitoxin system toxin component, PIN family [Thermosulfurimonas sp. F29]|uniref:putative toxin-antitoxin system toxin component, PIN family n=1 Tax=Thermosulfurimonas sp. F29 TaxID=2867247 RepID=UPI001C8397E8|nr:putative toxin-antitoxin system toxin component, PIN family [Thermosulfurimonas sp. F29]MBX6423901.1 putative toxin-antitoxin system toxin component, PIN family [Thermosulfurimonas sp. F29]
MRVVFNTNVLVAAFLTEGLCSVLLARARRKEFNLFVCPKILEEFERILSEKIKVPQALIKEALKMILEVSEVIQPTRTIQGVCRDEDDNQILACALSAGADYLVTGDKDLLEIAHFEELKIISPREFEAFFED